MEPAGDREAHDDPAIPRLGGRRHALRAGRARRADDRLHEEPPRNRADRSLRLDEADRGRAGAPRRQDRPLPGRLHAPAAARDRGGAVQRRPARPSPRRTRSSSGSTSGSWTPRSASTSRDRRQPAADVGTRRAAGAAGSRLRRREDALDQFFCRHPDEFIGRPVEAAILDHRYEQIQMQHLVAAAYESPLGAPATTRSSARAGGSRREAGHDGGAAQGARGPLHDQDRRLPRRAHLAAFGVPGQHRDRRQLLRRDDRPGRGRAGVLHRPSRSDLPPPWPVLRGDRAGHRGSAGRSSGRSTATTTRR